MKLNRVEVTEDGRGVRVVGTMMSPSGRRIRRVLGVVKSRSDIATVLDEAMAPPIVAA